MKDMLVLSEDNTTAGNQSLIGKKSTSIEKSNCCSSGDPPYRNQVTRDANQRVIEEALYFAACAEQNSEHPIAKGTIRSFFH